MALLLVDASIESYYAYDPHAPARRSPRLVTPPVGYYLVDCWTGLDTVFGSFPQVECFGVVFRSQAMPYSYVFAFRGTYSMLHVLEDMEFWEQQAFVSSRAPRPVAGVQVAEAVHVLAGDAGPTRRDRCLVPGDGRCDERDGH